MIKNIYLPLIIILFMASCSDQSDKNDLEYRFNPIGWSFKLPDYWVAQDGYDIDTVIKKHGKKLDFDEQTVRVLNEQKIFLLKTESSFNRFTSEIIAIPVENNDFEQITGNYKEQLSNQMMRLSPTAVVKTSDIQIVYIDDIEFKMFDVHFMPDSNKNIKFYMKVYMAAFEEKSLLISYTCIEGNSECQITQKYIEKSEFKKI